MVFFGVFKPISMDFSRFGYKLIMRESYSLRGFFCLAKPATMPMKMIIWRLFKNSVFGTFNVT